MKHYAAPRRARPQARFPRFASATAGTHTGVLSLWGDATDFGAGQRIPTRDPREWRYKRAVDRFVLETRALRSAVQLHQLAPVAAPHDGVLTLRGDAEAFEAVAGDPLLPRFLSHVSALFETPIAVLHFAPHGAPLQPAA